MLEYTKYSRDYHLDSSKQNW